MATTAPPLDGAQGPEALRLRLYRPDPPADAVAAYLAAVEGLTAAPSRPPSGPHDGRSPSLWRGPRRRLALRRSAPAALVLAALVAGFAALPLATRAQPGAASTAAAQPAVTGGRYPPVPGVQLGVLSGRRAGSGVFDAQGHVAIVSVRCAGRGTVALRLGADPRAALTCEADGTGLAMLESRGPVDRFRILVAPTAGVRWTLAVGAVPAG